MKKGRNDRRSFVVIAHQKTDRGSSHPSCAFRALCRWPDSRKDLIRCTVLYISFAPSPSALLFLSLSSLFSSVSLLSFLSSSSFTRVMPTRNSGYVCVRVCVCAGNNCTLTKMWTRTFVNVRIPACTRDESQAIVSR